MSRVCGVLAQHVLQHGVSYTLGDVYHHNYACWLNELLDIESHKGDR